MRIKRYIQMNTPLTCIVTKLDITLYSSAFVFTPSSISSIPSSFHFLSPPPFLFSFYAPLSFSLHRSPSFSPPFSSILLSHSLLPAPSFPLPLSRSLLPALSLPPAPVLPPILSLPSPPFPLPTSSLLLSTLFSLLLSTVFSLLVPPSPSFFPFP